MDNSSIKGEDQTMLLEEGGQTAVVKPVYASFTSQTFRLFNLSVSINKCAKIQGLRGTHSH
jgi:hypothetical protein